MAKSENLNDKQVSILVAKELERFNQLIQGHKKLLQAIGQLSSLGRSIYYLTLLNHIARAYASLE
jgi:hypothetical protein